MKESNAYSNVKSIAKVEAPDDTTVVFTLTEPDASFLVKTTSNAYCILDSEVVKQHGGSDTGGDTAKAWLDTTSAGSGPYVVDSWTPKEQLVLKKNANYWGESKNIDTIIFREMTSVDAQITALKNGEVDIILGLNSETAKQLQGVDGVTVTTGPTGLMTFLVMNDQVVAAAIAALGEGVRENQLASLVNREFLSRGADCEGTQLVCFGPNGADPHHSGDSTVLKAGDSVIFDIFTPIGRYWCDMTRTVFYRSVSDKQREVYELVRRANEAAEDAIQPGVLLSQLDHIAREIITDGGYGPQFTHRLGHGCGLDCHEPPDVSGVSDTALEPGMRTSSPACARLTTATTASPTPNGSATEGLSSPSAPLS